MAGDKFAFLKEESLSWRDVFSFLICLTLLLVGCHLLFHFVLWDGLPELPPKAVVVFPREPWSLPAIILGNFFHGNIKHLESNLLSLWVFGLWAFKQERYKAFKGMFYGALFCGAAQWFFGKYMDGYARGITFHLGFSGVAFALVGVLFVSCIRIGIGAIVPMCVLVYFLMIKGTGTLTLWPSEYADRVSWIGHLGGLIGGMYSQIKDPQIALRILAGSGWMTPNEAKVIHDRMASAQLPDLDKEEPEKSDDTDKEKPAPDKD